MLGEYSVQLLLLAAIKSERKSRKLYSELKDKTDDDFLKSRLNFLAGEETHHDRLLSGMFKELFPDENIILPESTPVPLPEVESMEGKSERDILKDSMDAESRSRDYYESFAERFDEDTKMYKTLIYLSKMEQDHYDILGSEIEKLDIKDFYEDVWESGSE